MSSEWQRLRQSLLDELKSRGQRYSSLDEYAAATNLLDRIDAELLATDTEGHPLSDRELAELHRLTGLAAMRAEQTSDSLIRDAAYDREVGHGPFSHLPPVRRAQDDDADDDHDGP
uniref:Uncharacterized protein n=1 Tax=Neobodo designis TaxID=312471 RepID=A0A7S1MPT1_NEODS